MKKPFKASAPRRATGTSSTALDIREPTGDAPTAKKMVYLKKEPLQIHVIHEMFFKLRADTPRPVSRVQSFMSTRLC